MTKSVLAVLALLGLLWVPTTAHAQGKDGASSKPPPPVVVAYSKLSSIAEEAVVTGTAEANAYVEIKPELSGRVIEILFAEGESAKAGTPLIRLDDRATLAKRDQAKAELANVEQQLARARGLREGTAVTSARIDELEAAVAVARAALRGAEVAVDQHTIKMPFDGVIGLRRVSVGAQVTENTIITTADDSSIINVIFRIPDVWLSTIQPGLPITLIPAQDPNSRLQGEVVAIDSRVDSGSRTIGIKGRVANPSGLVKPGSLVKVAVPLARREQAVLVPEQALFATGQQQVVFVADNGKAKRVAVDVGLRQRGVAEITKGLSQGAAVIASGADRLRDGAAINPAEILLGWEQPLQAKVQSP
jgi:membrane fusion protein (multidrug efflux system)